MFMSINGISRRFYQLHPHHILLFVLCLNEFYIEAAAAAETSCSVQSPHCVCSYQYLIKDLQATIQNSGPQELISRLESYECQTFREIPAVLYPMFDGKISEMIETSMDSNQGDDGSNPFSSNKKTNMNQPINQNNYNNNYNQKLNPTNPRRPGGNQAGAPFPHQPSNPKQQHPHRPHFGVNKVPHRPGQYNTNNRRKRQLSDSSFSAIENSPASRLEQIVPKLPKDTSSHHVYVFLGHRIQLHCSDDSNRASYPSDSQFDWVHSNGDPVSAPGVSQSSLLL